MGLNLEVKSPETGEPLAVYCKWKDINPDGHPIFVVKRTKDYSDCNAILDFGLRDTKIVFEKLPELELDGLKDEEKEALQTNRDAIIADREAQQTALKEQFDTAFNIYMNKIKTAAYECQKQFNYYLNDELKTPQDFTDVFETITKG